VQKWREVAQWWFRWTITPLTTHCHCYRPILKL